ncbi:MAG: hypothetical protein IJ727_01790 [Treponema sp.]|nr:hypothetical protein [Treponema sp.]
MKKNFVQRKSQHLPVFAEKESGVGRKKFFLDKNLFAGNSIRVYRITEKNRNGKFFASVINLNSDDPEKIVPAAQFFSVQVHNLAVGMRRFCWESEKGY